MRGRLERLAILPLRLDPDEALSGERCERLLLLEYFFATGRGQPLGMGAKLSGVSRHCREDVQVQLRVLSDEASKPFC